MAFIFQKTPCSCASRLLEYLLLGNDIMGLTMNRFPYASYNQMQEIILLSLYIKIKIMEIEKL